MSEQQTTNEGWTTQQVVFLIIGLIITVALLYLAWNVFQANQAVARQEAFDSVMNTLNGGE